MELRRAIRGRRMVRSFDGSPVAPEVIDRVLDAARRGPSAGFAQGVDLLVLEGAEQTGRYWDLALADPQRRARFRWPRLLAAPVLVVVLTSPSAYHARYGEADKTSSGAGGPDVWLVPWWWVDGGMAAMLLLLAAVDEGLGALLFTTEHPGSLLPAFGVPDDRLALATVALGHPTQDEPGQSSTRPRRPLHDVVHRGHW
ncbi:MAG: nitroreductase family protein [Actinomycetota bacterium]|nr:nitroreductase family protein [Actinomycetota bacterium]